MTEPDPLSHLPRSKKFRQFVVHMASYQYKEARDLMGDRFPIALVTDNDTFNEFLIDHKGRCVAEYDRDYRSIFAGDDADNEDAVSYGHDVGHKRFFDGYSRVEGFRRLRAYLRKRGYITDQMHVAGRMHYRDRHGMEDIEIEPEDDDGDD